MTFPLLVSAYIGPIGGSKPQLAAVFVESNGFEPVYADVSVHKVRVLSNATLLKLGSRYFVPLRQIGHALGFRLSIDESRNAVTGFLRNPSEWIEINGSARTGKSKFAKLVLETQDSVVRERELYVSTQVLEHLAKVKFAFDESSLEMSVQSDLPLSLSNQSLARATVAASDHPSTLVRTPYALATIPAFDLEFGGNMVTGTRNSAPEVTLAGDGFGDLLYQSAHYQLLTDSMGSPRALVNLGRVDTDGNLLGPLKANQYQFGLVSLPATDLLVGPRAGLGVSLGNFPVEGILGQCSSAEIQGLAPIASEVELYRGNQLLAVQSAGPNGYKFPDVLLDEGVNHFRVVILSADGDIQIKHQILDGNRTGLRPGRVQYRLTADRPEVSLIGSNGLPSPSYSNSQELIAEARAGISSGSWASANVAAFDDAAGEHRSIGVGLNTWASTILWHAGVQSSDGASLSTDIGATTAFGNGSLHVDGVHNFGKAPSVTTAIGYAAANAVSVGWEGFRGTAFHRESYGLEYLSSVTGSQPSELVSHWGLDSRNVSLWNEVTVPFDGSAPFGYAEVSAPIRGINTKLDLTYDGSARGWLQSGLLSGSRLIAPEYVLSTDAGYSAGLLQFGGTMYRLLGPFAVGLNLNASGQGLKFGFLLSTALSAMNRGPRFARPGLAEMGRIKVRVFLDHDGTGKFHKGNPPLANVAVRMVGKGGSVSTNHGGACELSNVAPNEAQLVALDEDSFSDPSWVAETSGIRVVPRAGAVCVVDLAITETAEIDGCAALGLGSKEAMTCTAVLVNANEGKELTSSLDELGRYLFSRVTPGAYILALRSSSGKVLASRPVTVVSGQFSTGFDLVKS